jgi:hypothetical protein
VTASRTPEYGRCPCGGTYEPRTVEVRMTVDGTPVVLSDVPQGRCARCDSRVYALATLETLERTMRGPGGSP